MIRLTLLLAFCIWLVFALGPDPQVAEPETADATAQTRSTSSGEVSELTLESGEVWQVDRVIITGAVEENTTPVFQTTPQDDAAQDGTDGDQTQEIADADVLLLYVTGTRVNLRAGPSTNNAVVAALTQGTATEFIAEAPDGWYEIRDPATGSTGFMSGDFLSPTQP